MQKQIYKYDVYGFANDCVNYRQCPLCYKCRSYDPAMIKCRIKCGRDMSANVCNTEKHKDDLVAKFVPRQRISVTV